MKLSIISIATHKIAGQNFDKEKELHRNSPNEPVQQLPCCKGRAAEHWMGDDPAQPSGSIIERAAAKANTGTQSSNAHQQIAFLSYLTTRVLINQVNSTIDADIGKESSTNSPQR